MVVAPQERLQVLIIGAGLCGLTAGASLRADCDVTILESAPQLGEIGAAVHLQPNSYRIVKGLGADLFARGAMPCKAFREYNAKTNKVVIDTHHDPLAEFGCEWALCHRVDLQQELMRVATTPDGPGRPCIVKLGTSVKSCDPETATVHTSTEETYTADVLIGADGIKSVVRGQVVGDNFHSRPSGHSAYRALIPAEKITRNPRLNGLGLLDNRLVIVNGGDRRIICYPTRNGKLLNFVCALPDTELNEISEEKWSARGDPRALVRSFASFDPMWQELLSQTEECGLWQLRDQDPLETWYRGRTIIVGDAAHSMLPHQGQGASQAIEDAEALGAVLSQVTAEQVPAALRRVFALRYRRATYIQEISRTSGLGEMRKKYLKKHGKEDQEDGPLNPDQHRNLAWGYYGVMDWEKSHPDWIGQY